MSCAHTEELVVLAGLYSELCWLPWAGDFAEGGLAVPAEPLGQQSPWGCSGLFAHQGRCDEPRDSFSPPCPISSPGVCQGPLALLEDFHFLLFADTRATSLSPFLPNLWGCVAAVSLSAEPREPCQPRAC